MSVCCRLILLLSLLLPACALNEKMLEVTRSAEKTRAQIDTQQQLFADKVSSQVARQAARHVDRPWLAGKPEPLARDVSLPVALRNAVPTTLLFQGADPDLSTLARRITLATGIPVQIRADALLPVDSFAPRLSGTAATVAANGARTTVQLSGEPLPLADILDRIAASLAVSWRYHNRRIEFYRTETRVFNIRALTLNASAQASLGSRNSAGSSGFASTSSTQLSSNSNELLDIVRQRIEPFLSRSGVLVAEPGGSASVIVTDSPEVLDQIALYIDHENRALTRRVRLIFEEITLLANDAAEVGLDWNLVFTSARLAAAAAAPGGVIDQAAALGVSLSQGPFQGSEAMVRALGKLGRVVRRSSFPVMTLNRRPVSHAVRTTFSYIDKVETTALGDGFGASLPTVSVSQKEETVGSLITVVPDAQDDGQILLSVAYDNTVAQPLRTITFGEKSSPLELQQLTIDGNGTVQQVALQPGQPLVISGFERSHEDTDGRRINPGFPMLFGGSDRVSSQQLSTVMIVTAQVEEGF